MCDHKSRKQLQEYGLVVLTSEDFIALYVQRNGVPEYHDTAVMVCGVFGQLNTPHADDEINPEYAPAANQHCTLSFIMTLLTQALHHSTQNTPNPPAAAYVPITSTSHCAVHCHIPLSLFKLPSYTETLCSAARPARLRTHSVLSNLHCCRHKIKESRRGEGNSLSVVCALATLKPNTLSCTTDLRVHTANYYFPYRFFWGGGGNFYEILKK
jgi:hypothetical protein